MRPILRGLGITLTTAMSLLGLGVAQASASTATPSSTVSLKVAGISRTGATVVVDASVVSLSGHLQLTSGPPIQVTPGTYVIAADVLTPASGASPATQAMVARRVKITSNRTIRLDSRGAKLLDVWLNGKNLGQPTWAAACIEGGAGLIYPDPNSGQLYIKPSTASGVGLEWATASGRPPVIYDLAGGTKKGLPSRPVFKLRTSELAKTVIQAKSGTLPDDEGTLSSTVTVHSCGLPGDQQGLKLPFRITDYRSPAFWQTEVDTHHGLHTCSMTWINNKAVAGRKATISFANAVHGPGDSVPVLIGKKLYFNPNSQFADPAAQQGYEYCFRTTVSLASGGHTLTTQHFVGQQGLRNFSVRVHVGRRYVMKISAQQTAPGAAAVPAGLLSPRVTMTWRFKVTSSGTARAVPVNVAALLPEGLNLRNDARPGRTTKIKASFIQTGVLSVSMPRAPVRSLIAQASYNDGRTWRQVAAARHKGYWLLTVHDPKSGYVTLRTTTVNSRGVTSVQTIYRAYGIS